MAGNFIGGLSDVGEKIVLSGPGPGLGGTGGPTLLEFTYSDAWQPATDGDGWSLVIRDPAAPPEMWKSELAWRRSASAGGSPGAADPVLPTTVAGRWLYYNKSGYDGTAPTGADSSDDNARATDKAALLPGQGRATFDNVSTYVKGLNGLFIDLADLPPDATITAADLDLKVGTGGNVADWAAAPGPTLVALRRGVGDSDRLTVTFADNQIKNTWLQVTLKANDHTGLAQDDVFYFGNLSADSGDAPPGATTLRVNALDLASVKRGPFTTNAFKDNRLDFDRDAKVNALDLSAVRANLGRVLEMIDPSAPPPAGAAPVASVAIAPPFSNTPVIAPRETDAGDVLARQPAGVLA